jgi:hypothetical protein
MRRPSALLALAGVGLVAASCSGAGGHRPQRQPSGSPAVAAQATPSLASPWAVRLVATLDFSYGVIAANNSIVVGMKFFPPKSAFPTTAELVSEDLRTLVVRDGPRVPARASLLRDGQSVLLVVPGRGTTELQGVDVADLSLGPGVTVGGRPLLPQPSGKDAGDLWVQGQSGRVQLVDPSTGTTLLSSRIGPPSAAIDSWAMLPDGRRLVADVRDASSATSDVVEVDTFSGRIVERRAFSLSTPLESVSVATSDDTVWVKRVIAGGSTELPFREDNLSEEPIRGLRGMSSLLPAPRTTVFQDEALWSLRDGREVVLRDDLGVSCLQSPSQAVLAAAPYPHYNPSFASWPAHPWTPIAVVGVSFLAWRDFPSRRGEAQIIEVRPPAACGR